MVSSISRYLKFLVMMFFFVQEENSHLSMNPWVPWRPAGSESWGIVVQHSLPEHSMWQGFIRFIPVVSCDIWWNPASRLQEDNEGFSRGNPVEPNKYHAMWFGRELCSWTFVAQLIESMTWRVPEMKCNNNALYHLYYHSAHKDLSTMFCRCFPYTVLESIQRKTTNPFVPGGLLVINLVCLIMFCTFIFLFKVWWPFLRPRNFGNLRLPRFRVQNHVRSSPKKAGLYFEFILSLRWIRLFGSRYWREACQV